MIDAKSDAIREDAYIVAPLADVLRGYGVYHYSTKAPAVATARALNWSVARVCGGLFCEVVHKEPTHGQVMT